MSTVIGLFPREEELRSAVTELERAGFEQTEVSVVTPAADGMPGMLTDLNVPERDAAYYTDALRNGGSLVVLTVDSDRAVQAQTILDEHGAAEAEPKQDEGWSVDDAHSDPGNFGDEGGSSQWGRSMLSSSASRLQSRMYKRAHPDQRPEEEKG